MKMESRISHKKNKKLAREDFSELFQETLNFHHEKLIQQSLK
jgi:hypothetical protein